MIVRVKIGPAALTEKQSFEGNELLLKEKKGRISEKMKQSRALQDFFRDTGGKINDLRVLRSAMFVSDEIDRAVRGIDQENQYVGWRQYNRFYAKGTEDMFTNVPAGKSPLVMATPQQHVKFAELPSQERERNLPIEYQATRRSHLKRVGRALDEIEQSELRRLESLKQSK